MFGATCRRLEKVSFATLFGYNSVLQSVFTAPVHKEAIVVEVPGAKRESFTYGRLQEDVIKMAEVITQRRVALEEARGKHPLSWLQRPRPANVRSLFADENGDGHTPSCDVMKDDGRYNLAIMGHTGYAFVVSLLAAWSLNQMAVPVFASANYTGELSYLLEHSGCRGVMGNVNLLDGTPKEYNTLLVCSPGDVRNPSSASPPSRTYNVESVFNVQSLLERIHERREWTDDIHLEHLLSEEERKPLGNAQDIMNRLSREVEAEENRREAIHQSMMREQLKTQCAVTSSGDAPGLCYDTDRLDCLNVVHRHWVENSDSCPSKHDDCLMIYTSGTTAKPKGAVHTHSSVCNAVSVLQTAWKWSSEDSILHMLPMYHIHGLVNVLLCSLASNARCVLTRFDDPIRIARRMERGDISLVMGVPTMYTKLTAAVNNGMSLIEKTGFKNAVSQKVRLMVSGSAALSVPTLRAFHKISGHVLLERYGMTEIGMALSQPLRPVEKRIPGTVGAPLMTVRAFLHNVEVAGADAVKGEGVKDHYDEIGGLAIASGSLFDRYWADPVATKKDLVVGPHGARYFNTGDTVGVRKMHDESGSYHVFTILGRSNVDIIKSRGYKLSALEIEAALLSLKDIFLEVAVVGCRDNMLGEMVVAVVVLQPTIMQRWDVPAKSDFFESPQLSKWLKEEVCDVLIYYKCPGRFIILPEIPRNPMGKVNKKNLKTKLLID